MKRKQENETLRALLNEILETAGIVSLIAYKNGEEEMHCRCCRRTIPLKRNVHVSLESFPHFDFCVYKKAKDFLS